MEYRLYNKLNCCLFDLIGDKEPDQTKGLGLLLAESSIAMTGFLELVGETEIKGLLKKRWVVDCELRQSLSSNKSLRADIVIRFYDGFNPYKVYVIEAKSVNAKIDLNSVASQIANYKKEFDVLRSFQEKQVVLVTLTNTSSLNQNIRTVTWQDIRNKYSQLIKSCKDKEKKYEIKIIKDYIHYINKIQGAMNFYDIEILSIPAGRSIDYINKYNFYECPINYPYGKKHPLYVAFRKGGSHGRIEYLYKIKNIYSLCLNDDDAIHSLSLMENNGIKLYPNIEDNINAYKKEFNSSDDEKWLFLLDAEESIKLPYPVEYRDSIRGLTGSVFLTLKEVFKEPEDRNGEKVVLIDKKN